MSEEALIEKYTPLIYKISKQFYNVEKEDLFQAGAWGLVKAYRNFNSDLNTSFMDYAYKHIFGQMYELANKSRDIKLSKQYLSLYKSIQIAKSRLMETLERIPTIEELSDYTDIDASLILEIMYLTTNMLSIDEEYERLNDKSIALKDCLGHTVDMDNQILIQDSLETLDPLEQKVIKVRYFEDLTQMETAKVLGISQVKVSRIEQKGKAKIKEYIAA